MRKVLLTGASGYAGAAIQAGLRACGLTVLTAGRRRNDDVYMDLLRPENLARLAIPSDIDALIHMAAANEVMCRQEPVSAYTANVTSTQALLRAAESAGIRRLLYLSTFHVFGAPSGTLDECTVPAPANDYGMTHWMAEQAFLMQGRRTGAQVCILRASNLFGEPADWGTFDRWTLAPFDFTRQAVTNAAISLLTNGAPVRNYVSLSFLRRSVIAALAGELPAITHIAGTAWSMAELAELSARIVRAETAREVKVSLGNASPRETAYSFISKHWPLENCMKEDDMAAFLRGVARWLMANPQ
ncbi:SDR family oxidoreductase [Cupriavidus basilensis]|uniref:SDR family oxidoreductase n=1 Tax=Cupriavidus basilensis TaxID=68895 RepID=A0ABT6ANP4_9BURK|nr:SDR family oxidoreductase [Cupriavidus basilensis]MDF3834013.1 SDR family oxidoreductase [Cupriavidus basilensis]